MKSAGENLRTHPMSDQPCETLLIVSRQRPDKNKLVCFPTGGQFQVSSVRKVNHTAT